MHCPHCRSTATTTRKRRTTLGYRRFNCRACGRRFNERTGTPFNDLQYLWCFKTSSRCIPEVRMVEAAQNRPAR